MTTLTNLQTVSSRAAAHQHIEKVAPEDFDSLSLFDLEVIGAEFQQGCRPKTRAQTLEHETRRDELIKQAWKNTFSGCRPDGQRATTTQQLRRFQKNQAVTDTVLSYVLLGTLIALGVAAYFLVANYISTGLPH